MLKKITVLYIERNIYIQKLKRCKNVEEIAEPIPSFLMNIILKSF